MTVITILLSVCDIVKIVHLIYTCTVETSPECCGRLAVFTLGVSPPTIMIYCEEIKSYE